MLSGVRRARAVLVVACASVPLALIACAGASPHAAPPPPRVAHAGADASAHADAGPPREAGPPPLEVLAARQAELAPGMREILRTELVLAGPHDVPLPAAGADTCLRAAFEADEPVRASLRGASGPLGDATDRTGDAGAARGALGAEGPVCVRKGDAPVLHLDGSGAVRVVVWASP